MRGNFQFAIAIIIAFLLASIAGAETYNLQKCIDTALQNNYGVIAARNTYDVSGWNLYSAYGEILPSVGISVNRQFNWSTGEIEINGVPVTAVGKSTRYGGSLSIGQSYRGLGISTLANIGYNRAQRRSNYYGYLASQNDLVLSIKEAYFNAIKAKMLVDVSLDAVKDGEEQLKVAQSRYELGSASLSDVLKAKVLRSNAKLDLITAENNQKLAIANLSFVMGIDVNEEFDVADDLPDATIDITYDQALNEALTKNPSYRKAEFNLSAAKSQLWMAKANILPTLSLSLSHSTSVNSSADLFNFEKKDASYYFGASLSFNVFNNLSDATSIVANKKSVSTSEELLKNTMNSVALDVKQAYLDVQLNMETMNLNDESVAAAQEDLNIVREKYNLGAATMLEVLDAEVSFKQAQVNKVQALFDYNLAISRLENVMGK
jgi:outer membrane protein